MNSKQKDSKVIRSMFNRIAYRYDRANRILSMGRDVAWRRKLAQTCKRQSPSRILDIATGTGDVLLALSRRFPKESVLIGLDAAEAMLAVARQKLEEKRASAALVQGDAQRLPLAPASVDCITVAFGVRNFADLTVGLSAINQVLKPGGLVAILEFSMPQGIFRAPYLFYLRHIVPAAGGLIAGDMAAYRYLNASIEHFPTGNDFCAQMKGVGFDNVQAKPFTFGIATLYTGLKRR